MILDEIYCTQPSLGKGEVVSSILTGSTTKIGPFLRAVDRERTALVCR